MAAESSVVRAKARRAARKTSDSMALLQAPVTQIYRTEIPDWLRRDMVQQAAYFRSESRGFQPGRELEDWLEAEREIDCVLRDRYP